MHFSTVLAAAAAITPIVSAHGGAPIPKIVGLNVKDLKARDLLSNLNARIAEVDRSEAHEKRQTLEPRQNTDGQCGQGYGSCAAGVCCSQSGWCGTDDDYCYSPGCNYEYGPGCPENVTPAGTNTSSVTRTKVGSVAYGGAGIYNCVTPGTVALTYDDGPFKNYTSHILDVFKSYDAKATFFITGNNINKGEIDTTDEFVSVIKRMSTEGHQIASHTWTHLDLSAVSSVDRKNQMWKNEMALRNILGFFPTYMRPPYSSCTAESGCEADMATLGYHVTYFDVDTDDYNQDAPNEIQNSKNWFKGNITAGGATSTSAEWLAIGHDIHEQTAYNLTEYMLSTLTQLGYKAVTVGECLGDDEANWYRSSSGSTNPTTTRTTSAPTATGTKKVSTDATCGGTNGYTCQGSTFGNCCSSAGWCGSTTDYCGTGCQASFGTCGSSSSSSSSTRPASSSSRPASSSTRSSTAATPSSTAKVSTDATCGGTTGYTCQGSTFGNCCSSAGWCGSTSAYCGTGCQSSFGTCSGSSASSSSKTTTSTKTSTTSTKTSTTSTKTSSTKSASPSSTLKVSTDGTCGGTTGFTCTGSTFGTCCSQYGWCGTTTGHCGTGCLKTYGTCT